ncbi:MAG: hypothetical protein JXL97_11505 [Bacteroidales bacterium]|nr:hypothetical protein [Bacteroidales bacterium]
MNENEINLLKKLEGKTIKKINFDDGAKADKYNEGRKESITIISTDGLKLEIVAQSDLDDNNYFDIWKTE